MTKISDYYYIYYIPRGTIYSGLILSKISYGITVSVIRDAATGIIVFTSTFLLDPSLAKVLLNPIIPVLAAE